MSQYEPIGKYLSMTYRALNSLLDEKLARYDIARGEFPFLTALFQNEGVSQKELCEYYHLDKALAARALGRLEKKDFVRREKDPGDQRQYQIFLTEKGKKLKPQLLNLVRRIETALTDGLSKTEVEQFMTTLKKMAKNIGQQRTGL